MNARDFEAQLFQMRDRHYRHQTTSHPREGFRSTGDRIETAAYCSLTETKRERVLWYPDRKGFLLGKLISDEWLASMWVPAHPAAHMGAHAGSPRDEE